MANESHLHAFELDGFWMDVGQPKDFLTGTGLYLNSLAKKHSPELSTGDGFVGPVLVHPSAKIGKNCKIGPHVTIGANVVIGDGVSISKSCIMEHAVINSHSWIQSAIVGWNCVVGKWVRHI